MGYALFASRKIYYTNLVYTLQSKLDNIMMQKQSLLNFSANISDGKITIEELATDATNFNNYAEYLNGAQEFINASDADGGCADTTANIGSIACEQSTDPAYLAAVAELLNQTVNETYAKQYTKKLEAKENELDIQQKKIETQLTAAQQQLKAVEEAEGQAIQNSIPKYNGVG